MENEIPEQDLVIIPAVETSEEKVEAAKIAVQGIRDMARADCPNAVEAGRQLERIADRAADLLNLLVHGRDAAQVATIIFDDGDGEAK